jgi:rod shape-determining protein MreC
VIARSPTAWYSAIQVDKGTSDGVREDQPVVTGDGLIGKVSSVTGGTARVTLITDASSAVSAQVMPSGANGIVKPKGVGNGRDLILDFVDRKRRLKTGDTVVTSGFVSSKLESLFPRGIPIGKVTDVEPAELELYQRIKIEPYGDLRRTDWVQVLTEPERGQRASTEDGAAGGAGGAP